MSKEQSSNTPGRINRRQLIGGLGAAAATTAATACLAQTKSLNAQRTIHSATSSFIDILRYPDTVTAFAGVESPRSLLPHAARWQAGDVAVRTEVESNLLRIQVASPTLSLTHLQLRWRGTLSGDLKVLGDQWERSYGDLEWRGLVPDRAMPWYFAIHADDQTHCYGVKTAARALAFWQADAEGITLWLDLRNGGNGVHLGPRVLDAAEIVLRKGSAGEQPGAAIHAFCATMCAGRPTRPMPPIFGSNDWYYAYGKNTASQIERDADLVASVSPGGYVRPFTIIDDGWHHPAAFPDMPALAASIRRRGVRPGIWVRPLQAAADTKASLLLPVARYGSRSERAHDLAFDPTIPEAASLALAKIKEVVDWGYDLVKHDFSTYELFGQWGKEMGASPTVAGWNFNDRSRTNAEIVNDLYAAIRTTAGEQTCILGCNTIGHLAAGLFEANRTGDDVSGKSWARTQRMGVNTLAFRLPQNRRFFVTDADCVPITRAVDWSLTRDWLDVVARSGTAMIISPEPGTIGSEQRAALREAFQQAAHPASYSEVTDWLDNTSPEDWSFTTAKSQQTTRRYSWLRTGGASPFGV
jgi:alpha-galactosidase